ncbi:hypothetical protein TNCV_4354881 [Trichonephila clavipes]|nr:hypothetical protein TNCV_4354881 [Trichonephila clavipes]
MLLALKPVHHEWPKGVDYKWWCCKLLTSYGTVGRNFRYALPVTVSDKLHVSRTGIGLFRTDSDEYSNGPDIAAYVSMSQDNDDLSRVRAQYH